MRYCTLPVLAIVMAYVCLAQGATVGAAGWIVVGVVETFINPWP